MAEQICAVWKPVVKISYDLNGGTGPDIDSSTVDKGAKYTITEEIPYRTSYEFLGWWTDGNYVPGMDVYHADDELQVSADMTLYAIWKPIVYATFTTYGDYSNGFSYYDHSIRHDITPLDGYRFASFAVYLTNDTYNGDFTFYGNEYVMYTSDGEYRVCASSVDFDKIVMNNDHENPMTVKKGENRTIYLLYEIPRNAVIIDFSDLDESDRPYKVVSSYV